MFNRRLLIEVITTMGGLLAFYSARSFGRNSVWSFCGSIAQVIASLLLVLLLMRWHWSTQPDRRWIEMITKAVLCGCFLIASLALTKAADRGSELASSMADILFSTGLLGAILFVIAAIIVGRRLQSPI